MSASKRTGGPADTEAEKGDGEESAEDRSENGRREETARTGTGTEESHGPEGRKACHPGTGDHRKNRQNQSEIQIINRRTELP